MKIGLAMPMLVAGWLSLATGSLGVAGADTRLTASAAATLTPVDLYRSAWRKHADAFRMCGRPELIDSVGSDGWVISREVKQELDASQLLIEALIEASQSNNSDRTDIGVDADRDERIPNLRSSALILAADAYRNHLEGSSDKAIARLAAAFRTVWYIGDSNLLAARTAANTFRRVSEVAVHIVSDTSNNAVDFTELRESLGHFADDDPFGVKRAIRGEQAYAIRQIAQVRGVDPDAPQEQRGIAERVQGALFAADASRIDEYYSEMLRLWDDDGPSGAMAELNRRRLNGEFGWIVQQHAFDPAEVKHAAVRAELGLNNVRELFDVGQTDVQNAAELYRAAWERHADLIDAFNAEQRRTDISSSSAEWTPEEETIAVLRDCRPLVEDLIAASRAGEASWGIGESHGSLGNLPHFGSLRQSARLLAADTRVQMVHGDHAAAAERIAAMVRMPSQLRGDDLIISALVAVVIFDLGSQVAELFIEGRPDPEHLRPIREAVDAMPDEDPFSMINAIKGNRRRNTAGLRDWIEAGAPPEDAPPMLEGIYRFAGAEVMAGQLERLNAYYEDVIEAWRSDNAPDRIAVLEQAVGANEYGMLARSLVPGLIRVYQADQRARAQISELRAMLEGQR